MLGADGYVYMYESTSQINPATAYNNKTYVGRIPFYIPETGLTIQQLTLLLQTNNNFSDASMRANIKLVIPNFFDATIPMVCSPLGSYAYSMLSVLTSIFTDIRNYQSSFIINSNSNYYLIVKFNDKFSINSYYRGSEGYYIGAFVMETVSGAFYSENNTFFIEFEIPHTHIRTVDMYDHRFSVGFYIKCSDGFAYVAAGGMVETGSNLQLSSCHSLGTGLYKEQFYAIFTGEYVPDTDPNAAGGNSGPGGGWGTFDNANQSNDYSEPPAVTISNSGLVTLFNPNLEQLGKLSNYLWSDLFSVETLKKIFVDPMDIILGLNIVPVAVPDGDLVRLRVAGFDTGINMNLAASQYVTVDCGSVSIPEFWGSALDYSPYTKIQLYLPYIGVVNLDTDDVMGRTIGIRYTVDVLTGACIAQIKSTGGTHSTINNILYHFAGHCAQNIPITGSNFSQLLSSVIGLATTAITTVATAGAAGAAEGASIAALDASVAGAAEVFTSDAATGAMISRAGAGIKSAQAGVKRAQASKAQVATNAINNTVSGVMGIKPTISHSGSISAVSGMLDIQIPYLIIQRPRQSLAKYYNHYVGYPSNIYCKFSELNGFTSFEQLVLEGVPATDPELAELYELLKGGVYF